MNRQLAACLAHVFVILLALIFFVCKRGFAEQRFLHAQKGKLLLFGSGGTDLLVITSVYLWSP